MDPFWGRAGSGSPGSPGEALCHLDSWGGGRGQWLCLTGEGTCSPVLSIRGDSLCVSARVPVTVPCLESIQSCWELSLVLYREVEINELSLPTLSLKSHEMMTA